MSSSSHPVDTRTTQTFIRSLITPEGDFIKVAVAYGVAIGLLTLAVPIAVQTLINTVVNIASTSAVVTLALLLFATLALSSLFSALRTHIMERFERHIYARLTAEISIRTLMAENDYFEGRRNTDITNRYFDIGTFQKNIPPLFVDGFALFLQMLVGFTLVSFYHPVFLAFCIVFILLLVIIWLIWGRRAVATAVELSHAKYATAKWLGDLASANAFFKSSRHITYAGDRTDKSTERYVTAHYNHFRYTYAQTIALLLLYALASSTLLGLGGVLVINGELSIGQLVAAELILTAIFFGLSQAHNYLKMYYELCGAADELKQVFDLPLEQHSNGSGKSTEFDNHLRFHNVALSHDGEKKQFNFELNSGDKLFVITRHAWLQRAIIQLLKYNHQPESGWIQLGGSDLRDYEVQQLRQAVVVIDRSLIIECTIQQFLAMSAPAASVADMQRALGTVGLDQVVARFPTGLQSTLTPLGAPLQPHEFLLLKLAAALLAQPKVVVLTQYFDNMPRDELATLLKKIGDLPFSVIYFSNHPDIQAFDFCLCLDWDLFDCAQD